MDKQYIAQRLKKYLFFISIIFIVLTTSHLIYSYIYNDAKETAIKGGVISEALIGKTPSFNPLKNNNSHDAYLNHILYRSLLTYDVKNKKIIPDLANCDTRNLLKIECFLNTNIKWSNGDDITFDDVIATFDTLKTTEINHNMSSILKNIKIEKTKNSIIFINKKKDINVLKIFFQPIVSKKILNIISKKELEGNFELSSGVYSGKYKLVNILKDQVSNNTTITLEKNNQYYKNNTYIDTILIKVFPSVADFIKNKNTINIFNDKNNLIAGEIPKLGEHKYILPQYVNVFLNTKRIDNNDLRSIILSKIDQDEILKKLGEKDYKKIDNPFLEDDIYVETKYSQKTLEQILRKKGFYKKEELIKLLKEELNKEKIKLPEISQEVQIKKFSQEAQVKNQEKENLNSAIEVKNPKSKIIFSPSWVDKYNFVSRDKYILKGKVPNQEYIYINDKKIKLSNGIFEFEISKEKNNLKNGNNIYLISTDKDGKKVILEEINFYLEKDKKLQKIAKEKFFEEKIKELKEKQEEKNKSKTIINYKLEKTDQYTLLEKELEKLDDKYFYSKENLEKFSLELYYISSKADIKITSEYIRDELEKKGIKVFLRQISTKDINQLILKGKKNYDIIITGINLSYFKFNIYPYYHSSQIEKGYNLSNFRKLDLDIVLEELKSNLLDQDKTKLLEKKVLKIIKENNLSKTIYTPILTNLVDKNIKGYFLEEELPEDIYRFDPIYKSYVNKKRTIILDNKTFSGYIKFIINSLFE